MNKSRIIIACLVVIIIGLVAYLSFRPAYDLPSTFTITTHGDFTSSGGDRTSVSKFSFVNNNLVSGSATYYSGAGGGCTQNCDNTEQCVVTDNQWVEEQHWVGCQMIFGPVPTKESFEAQIKSGDLTPKNSTSSTHDGFYYEITTP